MTSFGSVRTSLELDDLEFVRPMKAAQKQVQKSLDAMAKSAISAAAQMDASLNRVRSPILDFDPRQTTAMMGSMQGAIKQNAYFYERTMNNAHQNVMRSFTNINPIRAAMAGTAGSIGIATKALMEYRKTSDEINTILTKFGNRGKEAWTEYGRSIEPVLQMVDELYPKLVAIAKMTPVGGILNAGMTGKGADARRERDAIKKQNQQQLAGLAIARDQEDQMLRLKEDQLGIALRQSAIRFQEAKRELAAAKDKRDIDEATYTRLLKREEDLRRSRDIAARNEEAKRKQQAADTLAAEQERAATVAAAQRQTEEDRIRREQADAAADRARAEAAVQSLGFDREAARIDLLRRQGKKEEAEAARIDLDFRRMAAAINANDALTDAQRAEHMAYMLDVRQQEIALAKQMQAVEERNEVRTRSLAAGFAVGNLPGRVFGRSGSGDSRPVEQRQLGVLQSIDKNIKTLTRQNSTGTFAP